MSLQKPPFAGECHIAIGSMTAALRAQRLLQQSGIACSVVKVDGSRHGGCVYGVSPACLQLSAARACLCDGGIRERDPV